MCNEDIINLTVIQLQKLIDDINQQKADKPEQIIQVLKISKLMLAPFIAEYLEMTNKKALYQLLNQFNNELEESATRIIINKR